MHIWVDADACPVVIRDILFRAAQRTGLPLTLVANQPLRVPAGTSVRFLQVEAGIDVADQAIVQRVNPGDLVITSDIPLASEVIAKGGLVLTPRGVRFTRENISSRLTMRDFMETLRASGIQSGGPAVLNQRDRMTFANQLDRLLQASN